MNKKVRTMNEERREAAPEEKPLLIRPDTPQTLQGEIMQILDELNHTTDISTRLALIEGLINILIPELQAKLGADNATLNKTLQDYKGVMRPQVTAVMLQNRHVYKAGREEVATFPTPSEAGERMARRRADEKYMEELIKSVYIPLMKMTRENNLIPWTGEVGRLPAAELFKAELEAEDGEQ